MGGPRNPEGVKVETEELNKLKFVVLQCLTEELAEDIVNPPTVEVGQDLSFNVTEIMVRAVFHVLGREMDRVECRWPADWREAFKERWFPAWAKARWPVRWEVRQPWHGSCTRESSSRNGNRTWR